MNVLFLVLGLFLTLLGWWQLDHFVAPLIWKKKGQKIEVAVLPFIGEITLEYREFYILCYFSIFVGWTLTIIWSIC